jgi:RNA recognition motif-containing protein
VKYIYVGNLDPAATQNDVHDLFLAHGFATVVTLVRDRGTGDSTGVAFAEIIVDSKAQYAIDALSGLEFRQRWLNVHQARSNTEKVTAAEHAMDIAMGVKGELWDRRTKALG